jgi:hypothetical protein
MLRMLCASSRRGSSLTLGRNMKSITLPATSKLGFLALTLVLFGWSLDAVTGPLWRCWNIHAGLLEIIGMGLFWIGYAAIWILLPISAFRPKNRFYLDGDCKLRLCKFGTMLGLLLIPHILMLIGLMYTFS